MVSKRKHKLLLIGVIGISLIVFLYILTVRLDDWFPLSDNPALSESMLPTASAIASQKNTMEAFVTPTITPDLYTEEKNLPYDKLFITVERQEYKDGLLILVIPKLNLKESVLDGTASDTLKRGPGLYEYAQLPGEGNRNVSIAAHRNKSRNGVISEWYFYYIDTLSKGDYMYLTDNKYIYQYEYDQTTIVEPTDWGPIYSQGFSCITLTSCEPIGIADHRIIVRGKLSAILPYNKSYGYPSHN